MGSEIDRTEFTNEDYERFRRRLQENLGQLRLLLNKPGFGDGPPSFGAELELYIIDNSGQPMPINQQLAAAADDPDLSLELNRFNIEYNFPPILGSQTPFSDLKQQIDTALKRLNQTAQTLGARVIPIGILPTLQMSQMGRAAITDSARYHVLAETLRAQRGEDFFIHICGQDDLKMRWQEISLEGANTSFQYHYRVNPSEFADAYNAAQMVTPLLVALGANSPLFLGHRLWHETRVALFKQAIDPRTDAPIHRSLPSRVYFGHRWVNDGIYELLAEGVSLFPPIMPITEDEKPSLHNGKHCPSLAELRLHQGSIWVWNRPIFDPAGGGHLRIELRSFPAGPTSQDMAALAAFGIGLIEGLRPKMKTLIEQVPFSICEQNFYRAAREGIKAKLMWPQPETGTLADATLNQLVKLLLPVARQGLQGLGIEKNESDHHLNLIERSADISRNGALWQLQSLQQLRQSYKPSAALSALVDAYFDRQQGNLPVCDWRLADG
ncbi:hypothetical protein MIB92_06750 [Aestuariirhabdus sp. Z084]|uniref:hypothetical protein n=1 Tax=Aestuariirhabdus haliotis TaxID=2918751 RepID=UPI00201B451D|nr:hypothetical protein [Aestuariirhabdus haliotis]MCL6415343.1 hypothetical protein [Aestuariirhabdus haliotis]MCL6419099.1 hypothetical protein [Aestuariirhabdus haliotis]